jgi:hypothetical protein
MYQGTLKSDLGYSENPSYCVLAGAANGAGQGFAWAKIAIERNLPRGAGPLTARDGLSLRVDALPPTSTITSLTDGQYIQALAPTQAGVAPITLIIGGSAYDADAGVDHVSDIIDSVVGTAIGKETWTHPFSYLEGHHTIQTVAVDNVGFMEAGGPTVRVIADGTPPQITVPAQQLIPQRNLAGRWTIDLAGAISDPPVNDGQISPGSGVNPASVLVSILTNEGSQVVQPAVLAGSGWSAVIEFPAAIGDPTGAYTVTARAADNVGNQGEASGSLRLDVARVTATISQASAVCDTLI